MTESEGRKQQYLFRLRQSKGVKELVRILECRDGWMPTVNGWDGAEGEQQLSGWTVKQRVVVLRRLRPQRSEKGGVDEPAALLWPGLVNCGPEPEYEYQALVTDPRIDMVGVADLYRQRADAENVYDELKNQRGWGGFRTGDLLRCQVAARNVAVVYNWWNLFVKCAESEKCGKRSPVRRYCCAQWGEWWRAGGS